ncbi:MAG: DUF4915 domain-containing protein [Candidatus Riflebacteria bacterium]|nr:DUF4915 domain-containing protein [Candidatus Riflebacteria bacterium]
MIAEALARQHAVLDAEWREPAQIASQWREAVETAPELLESVHRGAFWDLLEELSITLLVTREYEHLVMALRMTRTGPHRSFMRLPHPSGLAVDRRRGVVHVASTRNPNQVYDLSPVTAVLERGDVRHDGLDERPLVPVRSHFLPGCLYLHDLALIGKTLHANAVGQNAVVRLASTDRVSARRPGHANFPVDRRGVLFSGATREPVARNLTRPHSARLRGGRVWVDNSGYGELGFARAGTFQPVARLPGWTRGLTFCGPVAFVGTSRVLPRFGLYAPGLDESAAVCGVHAVEVDSGKVLGSLVWPRGNQVFGIECLPSAWCTGFPFVIGARTGRDRIKRIFYAFGDCNAWETRR